MSFLIALFGLSIIVIVHELGHFIFAKFAGVEVEEFSVGMGKSIFKKKINNTIFSLRIFPLGGYVRVPTLEDENATTEVGFFKKLFILVSGSLNNFLFAWLIFFLLFFIMGKPLEYSSTIDSVFDDGPAYVAGLNAGDTVVKVDDYTITSGKELLQILNKIDTEQKSIVVIRNDKEKSFNIIPKIDGNRTILGIRLKVEKEKPFLLGKSLRDSLHQCLSVIAVTYEGLWMFITRKVGVDQVYGPVGIISLTSHATTQGIFYFFSFLAVLSINLSVINLFPFPALDGGRVVLLFVSKVFGNKAYKKIEHNLHFLGIIVLFLFVMYISYFDIQKILLK